MPTQYSTDLTITGPDGKTTPMKTYIDGDKLRNETAMNGLNVAFIVRKDRHEIFQLILNQKMAVELRYDPGLYKNATSTNAPEGRFESIGFEAIDGVPCSKFKVTSKTGRVYRFWMDPAKKAPVQMKAEGNSLTVKWTNFKIGPQPADLFEIPVGYQVMMMPNAPAVQSAPLTQPRPGKPATPPGVSAPPTMMPPPPAAAPPTNSGSATP